MKKLIVLVLSSFVVAAPLPGTSVGAAPAPSAASSTGEDASTNKADNAVIVRGDMGVAVPARGTTVTMEVARFDGTFDVLSVEHAANGQVRTTYEPGDAAARSETLDDTYSDPSAAGTTIPACSDSAYSLNVRRVVWQPYFLVNDDVLSATVPSAATMKQAILNAGSNIVNARNDCGLPDNVDAPALSGVGDTSLRSGVRVDNTQRMNYCVENQDVYSVVELGTLYYAFGATCWLAYDNGDVISSDIRFDRDTNWFIGSAPSCASTTYHDMEGTATHEMGHVYGLAHAVANSAPESEHTLHADLTMHGRVPTSFRKCSTRYRTLGKGDILGLESKY